MRTPEGQEDLEYECEMDAQADQLSRKQLAEQEESLKKEAVIKFFGHHIRNITKYDE